MKDSPTLLQFKLTNKNKWGCHCFLAINDHKKTNSILSVLGVEKEKGSQAKSMVINRGKKKKKGGIELYYASDLNSRPSTYFNK